MKHSAALRACALAGAIFMLASGALAAQQPASKPSCPLKQYGSIDLTITDKVLVPVTINDKPAFMSLNLTSATSALRKPALDTVGIFPSAFEAEAEVRFGSRKVTEVGRFSSLRLGDVSLGGGEFLVDPSPDTANAADRSVVGQLGLDVFRNVDFEIDLARRKLNLFSQEHCPGVVVYWSDTFAVVPLYRGGLGNLYLPLELDGKKVDATLSPASAITTLNTDAAKRLYGIDPRAPGAKNAAGNEAAYRAMQLSAPGLTVSNSRVVFEEPAHKCLLRLRGGASGAAGYHDNCTGFFPMKVGRNVLQELRLYFAMKEQKLYFTAAEAGK
jgi:hypothetical protein